MQRWEYLCFTKHNTQTARALTRNDLRPLARIMTAMYRASLVVLLVGCSSPPAPPERTATTPEQPAPRAASTTAPTEAPPALAPSGFLASAASVDASTIAAPELDAVTRCGRVGRRPLGAEVSLLDDRLRIRPVDGATIEARPWNIMAAPEPLQSETRLFLDTGGEKVVVMAYELFALAGTDFVEKVRADAATSFPGSRLEHAAALGDGLEALQVVPPTLDTSDEAVFTYALYVVSPDRTVQVVAFYVSPAAARAGSAECTALALRSARTLRIGARTLDLRARSWELVSGNSDQPLHLPLRARFVVVSQEGPDFWVHRVREVAPLGHPGASGLLYLGGHPSRMHAETSDTFESALLGASATWSRWEENGVHAEALREIDSGWITHGYASGPTAEALAAVVRDLGGGRVGAH